MNALDPFALSPLARRLEELAHAGVYIGTSSWKYPGWFNSIYTRDRYTWRGRFSNARFERLCLSEYSQTFKTVCVDAAYYAFPTTRAIEDLGSNVPEDFRFAFKVTGDITIKRFPTLARFGQRAGRENPDFLSSTRFVESFLAPCTRLGAKLGLMMFEFSRFQSDDFVHGGEFVEHLDVFLGRLPKGWRYGVEIRNAGYLQPEYFKVLARHGVAHIYNSWEGMPSVTEQLDLSAELPGAPFVAARFLLKPGRTYKDAVKRFAPYERVKEPYDEGVEAGVRLARNALRSARRRTTFIYVNNRFEGNAPQTIRRMLDGLERREGVRHE